MFRKEELRYVGGKVIGISYDSDDYITVTIDPDDSPEDENSNYEYVDIPNHLRDLTSQTKAIDFRWHGVSLKFSSVSIGNGFALFYDVEVVK